MNRILTYYLVYQDQLLISERDRMYEIFEENYDFVSYDSFQKDLLQKHFVLVLRNNQGVIQGFSTIALNPGGTGSEDFSIIFSGDTIISPQYWGSQELVKGFGKIVGQIYACLKEKKLYWFLISKSHRTYLYLHSFFKTYYPSPDNCDSVLKNLVDHCSSKLFPNAWSPTSGTIQFSSKLGQLKPGLAEATWKRAKNRHVQYFLQLNPSFHEGTELACMVEIKPDNILRRGKKFVLEGMNEPLVLPK